MKNRGFLRSIAVAFVVLTLLASAAFAVPQTINYQGELADSGGTPVDGTVSMDFNIYDVSTGGSALWSENQSTVAVTDGAFSVALGSVTPIDLPFDVQYYLGVKVGADGEMTPRAALASVPYAMRANVADTVADGAVTSAMIVDGSITDDDISASAAIAASKIVQGAGSTLDADLLDGQQASEIIDAASDEVRTPIDSLPFTISTPGSYYLTGDLSLASTTAYGITVNVDNVTIDLGGFSISGPGTGTGRGIYMNGRSNVEIKDGTVKSFGADGIFEGSAAAGKGHRVINVRAVDNGAEGIQLYGFGHLVKDVTALGNGGYGIYVYNGSTISGSVASNNGNYGIYIGNGATVTGNTVANNGSYGIYTGNGSTVTGNTAYNNSGSGISTGYGATVTGNTARENGVDGIRAGFGSTVKDNAVSGNQNFGINLGTYCLVDGNSAYLNNQSFGGYTNIKTCATCQFGVNVAP